MELNENANLDPGQVEDMRGSRGGRGGGGFQIPMPGGAGSGQTGGGGGGGGGGGLKIPGLGAKGGIGIVVVVLLCLAGFLCTGQGGLGSLGNVGGLGGLTGDDSQGSDNTQINESCDRSNPDRFKNSACVNLAFINSIQAYWQRALPENFGVPYQTATTRYFSGQVNTACGPADSGVGPFYCPGDNHVYIDLTFYDQLARQYGAPGQFAQAYVLAHEYGHHIQTILGTEAQMRRAQQRDPRNANAYSVMLELQADCYAGVWATKASTTTDAGGAPIFTSITQQDINEALTAAAAVGDDTIQKRSTGRVNESSFTHGSAAQRQQWFDQGFRTGDPRQCNTFGDSL